MAIAFVESPDSRELNFGATGGGFTLKATARTTAGESEGQVWLAALVNSLPFQNGFIRNDLRVRPKGAAHLWDVEITYGTTGVGGGDQPLGGVDNGNGPVPNPTGPAATDAPLTGGWSFNIEAPTLKILQSKETVNRFGRIGYFADPPDFAGAIGVAKKGPDQEVEGAEVPPEAAFTFSRTVAAAVVTQAYLNTLSDLAGRPNAAPFYGWDRGEVLLKSATGQYTEAEKWSITFTFAVSLNATDIVIVPDELVVTEKNGWDYLWCLYSEVSDGAGRKTKQPVAAYIERVFDYADFSLLNIGS